MVGASPPMTETPCSWIPDSDRRSAGNDEMVFAEFGFVGGSGYRAGKASRSAIQVQTMSEQLPDRLSVNPDSPFYDADVLARDIGIRFKGVEKNNVEEYCVSEGWVKVAAGNAKDRFGRPMTITLKGPVEPYIRGNVEG